MADVPKIYAAMINVMREAGAIAKARKNQQQNYQFRGIDDVYNALHAIMGQHGVFTTSEVVGEPQRTERTTKNGTVLFFVIVRMRYTFWAEDGSNVTTETIGEGMDSGDKATNKAMAVAHKYALLQALLIPTEEPKDPENDSYEVARREKPKASPTHPAPAPAPKPMDEAQRATMRENLCDSLREAPGVDALKVRYTNAYRTAKKAGDEALCEELHALYKMMDEGLQELAKEE